ncbi:MAG TPA: alpha/beta hydrolase [Candidatus Pacearchaeota archaeon]|nr:alpha/beta hydrolase [Candidatus Pacearchaeota archaeon]
MFEYKILINNFLVNHKIFGASFDKALAGVPILVLHGWGVGSESWVGVAELMAKEGYRVIVPDMPGFGKSAVPEKPWTVDDYVEWVKDFADKLEMDGFILIGHSFGGQVAAKFCAICPKKVDKLVLCAAAVVRKPRLGSRQILAKYLAKTKIIFQNIPFGIYPVLRKIVYRIAGTRDYAQLQGVMAQTFLNVVGESVIEFAKRIKTPTLIIWGDKDRETPIEDAREINNAIAGSRLEIIPGAGHKLHRTHAQILAEKIINFLKL